MDEALDHVLVVDDDESIRELVCDYLAHHNMHAIAARDGHQMWAILGKAPQIDLIILDLLLPGEDGLSLFRALRAGSHAAIPVLMLTARSENVDRIIGLELGADDYLTKPFILRELVARIRSVLRRVRMMPPEYIDSIRNARYARFGDWKLDLVQRRLFNSEGVVVPLGCAEYELLHRFIKRPQQILSRDQLIHDLSGRELDPLDRSIDLRVSRLRRRLNEDVRHPELIQTVRNEGYVFTMTVVYER